MCACVCACVRERANGRKKPVFLRRARRGAFRCDYKSRATPGVSRRRGLLSKTDHRTEKAEKARNSSQCQEIKVSLYIYLYSSYASSSPVFFDPSPVRLARRRRPAGRSEGKKTNGMVKKRRREKRKRDHFADKRKHRMGSNVRAS